jgi:hypothetical protein
MRNVADYAQDDMAFRPSLLFLLPLNALRGVTD